MSSIGIKTQLWPGLSQHNVRVVVLPVDALDAPQPQLVVHLLTMENYAYYEQGRQAGGRGAGQGRAERSTGRERECVLLPSFCY